MRHKTILAAALFAGLATPAFANPHVDRVVTMLQSDGYESIEIERTWLGRIRIEAEKGELEREIVLNRSTGEILRDYIVKAELFSFVEEDDDEELEEGEEEEDSGENEDEEDDDSDGGDDDD